MKSGFFAASATLVAAAAAFSAHARNVDGPGNIHAGRELAQANCSGCHIVAPGRGTLHPPGFAPDFADLAQLPSTTRTSLYAFLRSPHPTMPNLILSDRKADDVIAYILSLKRPEKS